MSIFSGLLGKKKTDFRRASFIPTSKAKNKLFDANDNEKRWIVLSCIISDGSSTAQDIAEELNVPAEKVEPVLERLVSDGYIQESRG